MLEAVIDNFPGGIALFNADMRMVICNERLKALLEYPAALFAAGPPSMEQLFTFNAQRGEYGPGDPTQQVAAKLALAREPQPHVYERRRPDGRILEVRGAPMSNGGFVTTYFDVTERRQAQDLVVHMAHHDSLTGLANRRWFFDQAQRAIAKVGRGKTIAIHCLDLDGFKPVNDEHGHAIGDALLVAVAKRLNGNERATDVTARLGGDEFAVLQVGIENASDALALGHRLLRSIGGTYAIADKRHHVGVSVGVAVRTGDTTIDELMSLADAALFRSKMQGRGRLTLASADT